MLLKIYETKGLSFKNETSLGREMVECAVAVQESNQLDQNRKSEKPPS